MANILRLKQGGPSSYACPPLITAILILVACMFGSVGISADEGPVVRIMTQNMYEGTNFQELAAAQSTVEFLTAVATTYQNIDNTKPAERAAAIAREIADYHPDLIALQEASIVRTGPTLSPPSPATIEHSNLLQLLLDELARLGQHYATVAVQPLLDAQAPSTLGFDVRLTTQDAILARTDLPPGNLKLSNIQIQRFQTNLMVPTPVGSITFPRGWISIDVKRHGRTFKFVTTHLEVAHLEVVPSIQLAQAMELVQSTGDTTLPLVFAGDFNASADDNMDPTFATYQNITTAVLRMHGR